MSLLTLEGVGKRYRDGQLEGVVLRDVSLAIDPGELVAVWSPEDSGRSTLLRIAAGIERPDTGVTRFDGRDLAARGGKALGRGIGYCRQHRLSQGKGRRSGGKRSKGLRVLDDVMVGPLAVHGVRSAAAKTSAQAALERVGAADCADLAVNELDRTEVVRVILAGALSLEPRLLLIYEPISDLDDSQRDGVLLLLRSLAADGIAILMTFGETTRPCGVDRALALVDGELQRSVSPELPWVVPLNLERSTNASRLGPN
jgi:ABC-type cobalamin/Fe3+-siderophores transport system ATPase subunit